MTSFCRHRRLEATCPVCSRQRAAAEREAKRGAAPARQPAARRQAGAGRPRRVAPAGVSVRRVARAADDGYACELVLGLTATADAERLAYEIAAAQAELDGLRLAPAGPLAGLPGLAAAGAGEEALWRVFLVAVRAPPERAVADPGLAAALATPWAAAGELEPEGIAPGPAGVAADRLSEAVGAYRAWAQRAGGQAAALAGEPAWSPQRRFERAFERLALPGLGRAPRYGFLRTVAALGLADLDPASLQVGADPRDPVAVAAKRVFGIGDAVLLERRAADLARACGAGLGTLELALRRWGAESEAGAERPADPAALELARSALWLPATDAGASDGDAAA